MARKRKSKRGASSRNLTPLVLIALALVAAVVYAVWPQHPRKYRRPQSVAIESATPALPQPTLAATPQPSPEASPLVSPSPSPTIAPQVSANPNAPRVAIIIDDCGQWLRTERGYLALPIPLTLAVLPHVRYTKEIAREAAEAGKGVMLHLPMEPLSHIYPGPGEITTAMSDDAITAQTEDDVLQVPLAKGVNNHEGSQASADARVMRDVMTVIKAHGLFFVDSRTNADTVGEQVAQENDVPTAPRNVFLDNQADVSYTESMLERTVEIAKHDGYAIAIGHPKPTTLEALREDYPKMQAQGVQFVLAEQLVR